MLKILQFVETIQNSFVSVGQRFVMMISPRYGELLEPGVHESPDIHGSHLSVIISIIPQHPGEHLTHHTSRDQLHPLPHLLHQLHLLLRQTDQAPTHRVLVMQCRLPYQTFNSSLTQALERLDSVS